MKILIEMLNSYNLLHYIIFLVVRNNGWKVVPRVGEELAHNMTSMRRGVRFLFTYTNWSRRLRTVTSDGYVLQ